MARLQKNNKLSGTIGNIVFVSDGDRAYARSKPGSIRQTENTKDAARAYGHVSSQEKKFRLALQDRIAFANQQYFSARHVARLKKTVSYDKDKNGHLTVRFMEPTALVGFDFNQNMAWDRCTNFFPSYEPGDNGAMTVRIPALAWGKEIKAPRKADLATLNLYAVSTDLELDIQLPEILSSLSVKLNEAGDVPAREWQFNIPGDTKWLLILAVISFESAKDQLEKTEKTTGTYLWAKRISN